MHFRCEHNKDSMFAIGPCDDCKNKLDNVSRSTKLREKRSDVTVHSVYRIKGQEKLVSVHVHWADELNQPLEDVQVLEEKSSGSFLCHLNPKPILKIKQNCVVFCAERK